METYLKETIDSVLCNLRPGDEYFIIDGGSTDSSVEIIRRYESRISGWISERDSGYADALSKGFSFSKAKFQCWINSGDILLKGALHKAHQLLEQNSADMIFGDDLYIDEESLVVQVSSGCVSNLSDMMLYGGWTPLQDACFWKRALYETVGGIDPRQKYAADFDLFLKMSLQSSCHYVPHIFSGFRRHRGQKSLSGAIEYKREREACQRREFKRQSNGALYNSFKKAYYWPMARLKARFASRVPDRYDLVRQHISNIACHPTKVI